ncbi:hypothetical protein [Pedobacter sp. ASV12]|uniref:hypothetical protein n=1 Tax=Pedobacter sp. ASV12 TaxID=2795120 RepID=UPI0018EACA88|nr:hypothetical protein [Pedobacter sp. ASV12]
MQNLDRTQVQAYYESLFDRIEAKYYPINVEIRPDPGAVENNCFNNVAKKVGQSGGSVCYGWAILPQLHILEAERHAIWKTPQGLYLDITPRSLPITSIQFVIDDSFEYNGQIERNIRINVTDNTVVDDWILICEAIDELYANCSVRIDEHHVGIHQHIAPYLKVLESFVKEFLPFIQSGGNPDKLCFCGNPLFYKDCHGLDVKGALKEDLKKLYDSI